MNKEANTDTYLKIKKIAISRDDYALLNENGEVIITNIYTGESRKSAILRDCIDIAGGFHNFIGLKRYGDEWHDVKKICCGNHGCVFGLTNRGGCKFRSFYCPDSKWENNLFE